jgi:hypothetical protein
MSWSLKRLRNSKTKKKMQISTILTSLCAFASAAEAFNADKHTADPYGASERASMFGKKGNFTVTKTSTRNMKTVTTVVNAS